MHQFRCLQIIQRPHIINFKASREQTHKKGAAKGLAAKANGLLSQDVKVSGDLLRCPESASKNLSHCLAVPGCTERIKIAK